MSKRLLIFFLVLVRVWYVAWATISIITSIFLVFWGARNYNVLGSLYKITIGVPFLIECISYVFIIKVVKKILAKEGLAKNNFSRLSNLFWVLLLLDLVSILMGNFSSGDNKNFLLFILNVLPKESDIYIFYESIYKYLPIVFNFLKPHISGSALIIFALVFRYLSLTEGRCSDARS